MKKYLILTLVLTLFIINTAQLQAGVSDAAVLFLRIAAGARAAGMGEAFVAVADDATSTHWNPAGLGMYPLSSEYHTFKVDYNPEIVKKAMKVLKGDWKEGDSETYRNFEFLSDGVYAKTDSDRKSYEEYLLDQDESALYFVISRVNSNDRDMLKMAVRAVAKENTGISFDEINKQRRRLIDHFDDGKREDEINDYFEKMLVSWQELKIKTESIQFLDEKITFALADNQIDEQEYGEIMMVVDKAAEPLRSEIIKVPYTLLLSLWKDYASPWNKNLKKIALVENGLPENNFRRYNIWAISSSGLTFFDSKDWHDGITYNPKRDQTAEDVIMANIGLENQEDMDDMKVALAEANSEISWDELSDLINRLNAKLPAQGAENLQESLEILKTHWLNLTANQERLKAFVADIENTLKADEISMETIDRLSYLAARVDNRRLPEKIVIPFGLVLTSELTSIAGTGNYLWVGTNNGLYRLNTKDRKWHRYTSESGLPDNQIMSMSTYDQSNLWVATKTGVAHFNREKWTKFDLSPGHKDTSIYLIHAASKSKVWAVSENNFYTFNGNEWVDYFIYETAVNDTLSSIVKSIIGYTDNNTLTNNIFMIKAQNQLESDVPAPGTKLKIPYKFSVSHRINHINYDSKGRLWLGTDYGVKILYDGKFTLFGYKLYVVEQEMTIEEIAADFLVTDNTARIDQLARIIKDFNQINTNKLPAGSVVYIYTNPLGSKIYSIESDGNTVYIGTERGLIKYTGDRFSYFYQEGLEKAKAVDIHSHDGEIWFVTSGKVVVFANAKSEITGMHANWLPELADDIYYEYLSYIHHLGEEWGTLGISVTFLSYGELVRVNEYNEIMGTFNSFDMAIGLTYGKKMSDNISAGLTAKWIYSRLSDQGAGRELGEGTGSSLGIDIGLLYKLTNKLTFGAAITNIGPDISYIDAAQSDPLPRNLALGLSYKMIDNPYNRLILVFEVNKMLTGLTNEGFFKGELEEAIENFGFEYWYGSFIAFRAGYIYDQVGDVKTPTLGVGIQYRGFRFDFAYIPSSDTVPLANTVRFSLTGRI